MDIDELLNEYKHKKYVFGLPRKYPNEYNLIKEMTSFLPLDSSVKRRLFHIYNKIASVPLCRTCKINTVNWYDKTGYTTFCSSKCQFNDPLLSEHENMIVNKIYRIYNSGLKRYVMKKVL